MSPEISRAHLSVSRPGSAKGGESILEKVRLSRYTEYIEPICKNYSEIFGICNNDFPVHIHDDIEIVHILSGDRMAIIESREYYEPEGSLTVIFPFQRHGYRTLNGGQHNVICIDPQYLFGYSERLFSFMPSDPVLRADELGERAAALLSVIMDRSRPRDKVQTNALITALLPELFGPLGLRQRADFSLSGEILPLVMEHCREPSFSLLALSRFTGIGERTLSGFFSKSFGMSFGNFIRKYRLNLACSLLRGPQRVTVTEIAYDCGFSSVRTFNRCFREEYGMSPSRFSEIDCQTPENGET